MTSIYTDEFCYVDIEVALEGPNMGRKGRELVVSTLQRNERELRFVFSDEQLNELAETLEYNGYKGAHNSEEYALLRDLHEKTRRVMRFKGVNQKIADGAYDEMATTVRRLNDFYENADE